MKNLFRGLRGGLAFETTLSLSSGEEDFWKFVDRSFLFPVVGIIVGLLLGGVAILFSYLPGAISAGGFLVVFYLVCGILHTDGLADFADGLVKGGSHSERLEVMKDEKTGAAGLVVILVTNILLFSALVELFSVNELYRIFVVILATEVLSKLAMYSVLFFGRCTHQGMASTFMKKINWRGWLVALAIALVPLALFYDPLVILPLVTTFLVSFGLVRLGNRVIGGINGDIAGASGEIVRPLMIIIFILIDKVNVLAFV
ncbi:MAG: adenosylcobinamide-GDP ribazoletransferase [Candidatus Bipolaricaulota bacterium]